MSDIGLPVVRSTNIDDQGLLDLSDIKFWYRKDPQGASTERYFLKDGDILVNFINSISQIGKSALYQGELDRDAIYTTNIFRVRVHERILPEYLLLITRTRQYAHYIHSVTKPAVNQASFTTGDFVRFRFLLSPLSEQRKIAEILGTWDEAIALTEQLIAAKQQRKKGLMQQLLTGKRRFKEFEGEEWRQRELREFFHEFSERNTCNRDLTVLSCSTIHGIVPQSRIFSRRIASQNTERYKVVNRGDLVYDPMLLWDASIGFLEVVERGVVSPAYSTFKFRQENGVREFFKHLIKTHYLREHYKYISQGTNVRRRKAPTEAFYRLRVPIPSSKAEQRKIASVLEACDREIDLLTQKLNALQHQKKGLMQQLLTGNVRVNV